MNHEVQKEVNKRGLFNETEKAFWVIEYKGKQN